MNRRIRALVAEDIPAALDLCREAGWNQVRNDWVRLLEYEPDGCFGVEIDGQLVGTVTTTRYGTPLAWIGMMLVREDRRRQGVATDLINASLDYLRSQNVQCIKLDATPAGQFVYERMGFQVEWSFQRWARDRQADGELLTQSDPLSASHRQLDHRAFLVDRFDWLERLAGTSHVCACDAGFGMLRQGFLAGYLGPVVADAPMTATQIIQPLLQCSSAPRTFWDVMNPHAAKIADSFGFQPVRDLTRMWIGSKLVSPDMAMQYAISDPGTG